MTRMFLALISLAVFPAGGVSQTSGFSDFVFDLVDLEKLARVDYTPAKMVSSYDRTGANDDGFNQARLEGVTYTIADLKGPGVIRRMWTARPRGKLHIYLDGDPKPIVSVSAHDFFAGRKHPFPRPIVGPMGRGYYSYFPIPFAGNHRARQRKRDDQRLREHGLLVCPPGSEGFLHDAASQGTPRSVAGGVASIAGNEPSSFWHGNTPGAVGRRSRG